MTSSVVSDEVIANVFVVGFHHKKGCMVEFSYPPLSEGDNVASGDLPEPWKHLPTLALPDGAHNYEEDTIYFHLPALDDPSQTVYGISCYRQMSAQQLLRRSSDITRETVQKSVCVLSRLPLFGLIQAKLELITHAYFDERDFTQVSLLEEMYRNLNSSLPKELLDGRRAFLGLSVREFVLRFKHKSLLLFKLLLLEKKVLFYKAPVKELCSAVLTLCSLIPGMIEHGLCEAATSTISKTSPGLAKDFCGAEALCLHNNNTSPQESPDFNQPRNNCTLNNNNDCNLVTVDTAKDLTSDSSSIHSQNHVTVSQSNVENDKPQTNTAPEIDSKIKFDEPESDFTNDADFTNDECTIKEEKGDEVCCENGTISVTAYDIHDALDIESSECGMPLAVFTKGMLCHPYLSLPFLDLLNDVSIRGFLVGATNILFKQKKHLFDVIVEVDDGKIEIYDSELRKQLNLTTEDLRFADHLLRHVMEDKKDVFLDGTGWEGGDEWLRSQFKLYLISLMRTSLTDGGSVSKDADAFNTLFLSSWKLTHNYRMWSRVEYPRIVKLASGHPFHGQLSMADMKLKFSHSMQSSEKGRRINSAVATTGKAVYQTGKAVGGAFSSAKSAVSSWWSTFNAQQEKREDKSDEPETLQVNSNVNVVE